MPDAAAPNPIFSFLPIIFVFLIFYGLVIRPQQKRQKMHDEAIRRLEKGNQVVTSGGVHGMVVGLKDDSIILKIADNVKIEVSRSAIQVIKKKAE